MVGTGLSGDGADRLSTGLPVLLAGGKRDHCFPKMSGSAGPMEMSVKEPVMNRSIAIAGALFALAAVPSIASEASRVVYEIFPNRDDPGRNFYSQSVSCTSGSSDVCQANLPAIPAGTRLVVEHVSVIYLMPAANTLNSGDLRTAGGDIRQFLGVTAAPGNYSNEFIYTTDVASFTNFEAGEAPQFNAYSTSTGSFTCVIRLTGYTVTLS